MTQAGARHAFIEAFNARLRDECLNETIFTSLPKARAVLQIWMTDYNGVRPHSAIRNLPPALYARLHGFDRQQGGTPERDDGSAPAPLRNTAKFDYLRQGLSL